MNHPEHITKLKTSKQMNEEIKPCPFCGGRVEIKPLSSKGLWLRCSSCLIGIRQKTIRFDLNWLREKMIEDWNKRTSA